MNYIFYGSSVSLPKEVRKYIPPCFQQFKGSVLEACLVQDFHTWQHSITSDLLPDGDFKYEVTIRTQQKKLHATDDLKNRVVFLLIAMVPNRLAMQLKRHRDCSHTAQFVEDMVDQESPFDSQHAPKTLVTLGYFHRSTNRAAETPEEPGLFTYAINLDDDEDVLNKLYGQNDSKLSYNQTISMYYHTKAFISPYDVFKPLVCSNIKGPKISYFTQDAVPTELQDEDFLNDLLDIDVDSFLYFDNHESDPKRRKLEDARSRRRTEYRAAQKRWSESDDPWVFYPLTPTTKLLQMPLRAIFETVEETSSSLEKQLKEERERLKFESIVHSNEIDRLSQEQCKLWKDTVNTLRKRLMDEDAPQYSTLVDFCNSDGGSEVVFTCILEYMREQCGLDPKDPKAVCIFDVWLCKQTQIERQWYADRSMRKNHVHAGALVTPYSVLTAHSHSQRSPSETLQRLSALSITTVEDLDKELPEQHKYILERRKLLALRRVCKFFNSHVLTHDARPSVELYVQYKRFRVNIERLKLLQARVQNVHNQAKQKDHASATSTTSTTSTRKDLELLPYLERALMIVNTQSQGRARLNSQCDPNANQNVLVQTFLKKPYQTTINLQLSVRKGTLQQLMPYGNIVKQTLSSCETRGGERLIPKDELFLYNECLYLVVQLEMEMFSTNKDGVAHLAFVEPSHKFLRMQNQQMAQNSHVLLTDLMTRRMRNYAQINRSTVAEVPKYLPKALKQGAKPNLCKDGGSTLLWPVCLNFSADDINRQSKLFKTHKADGVSTLEACQQAPQTVPTGRMRFVTKVLGYTVTRTANNNDRWCDEAEFDFVAPEVALRQRVEAKILSEDQMNMCMRLTKDPSLCIQHEPFEMATKTRLHKFESVCAKLNEGF